MGIPGRNCFRGEAHLNAVIGGNFNLQALSIGQVDVQSTHDHIHGHGFIRLILQYYWQINLVAKVQEPRC